MSDIVTRLWGNTANYPGFENIKTEAAREIERLRDELAAWKSEAEAWRLVDDRYPMTHSPVVREARERRAAADAPKRKHTVADIQKPKRCVGMNRDYWYIRCGEYDWTSVGWAKQREGSSGFQGHVADVIYAGLVATGNVPEVGE